jgi:putative transposase
MKRSRFTEEQIIGILKEQEAGEKTADVCRKYGISDATFYKYKAKYCGMNGLTKISSKPLRRHNIKQQNGSGHTTMNAPTWASAE